MKDALEFAFSSGWRFAGVTLWVFLIAAAISDLGRIGSRRCK